MFNMNIQVICKLTLAYENKNNGVLRSNDFEVNGRSGKREMWLFLLEGFPNISAIFLQ